MLRPKRAQRRENLFEMENAENNLHKSTFKSLNLQIEGYNTNKREHSSFRSSTYEGILQTLLQRQKKHKQ